MKLIRNMIRELKAVLLDKDIIILLLVGPVVLTLLLGSVYLNSYVEDIPIAVLDEDNSSTSRMIVQQFKENEHFDVKYVASSKEELRELIETRKAYMGLYIPPNFSSDISTLHSTEALILVDGANTVIGNNAYAAASSIIQTIAAGVNIKLIEAKGMMPQTAKNMGLVFNFSDRTLYDPRMTYMNYMVLGLVAVFLQQVMLSGVGISVAKFGREMAEEKTVQKLLYRILSCAFFALASSAVAVGIAAVVFKVPIRGNLASALLLCMVFILAISCPAILLGAIVKDKIKFVQVAYMLSLPAFISSGYVWPQDQMPQVVSTLIKVFWPLMNFARPFDELLFKGSSLSAVSSNILQMLLYTAFWMPVSIFVLRKRTLGKKQKSSEEVLFV